MIEQNTCAWRRALLIGTPALAVVTTIGAGVMPALCAPASIEALIAAHKAAWAAFSNASDRVDTVAVEERGGTVTDEDEAVYQASMAPEEDALAALLSYPCRTMAEIEAKATYLATTTYVIDGILDPDQLQAFVRSMIGGAHV